jgi:hypothetical protein
MATNLVETEEMFNLAEPESDDIIRQRLRDAAAPIISRLSQLATDAATKRKDVERRWLADMCQYAGVRDVSEARGAPEVHTTRAPTGSQVFVNITRPKTNRVEGRICDILFPADDKNWGIQPTPVPELSTVARRGMEEAERAIADANRLEGLNDPNAVNPDGMGPVELLEKAEDLGTQAAEAQVKLDEAKRRCELMSMEIDDQLVEAQYAQKARDAIGWACKIGIGVIKGPVLTGTGKQRWAKGDTGYSLQGEQAPRPSSECTSPWAFFPDPSATCMADAEYALERHLPSGRELRSMARKLGFDKDTIKRLLEDGPGYGSKDDLQFLSDIRLLTGENAQVTGRYVVWEYHGQLTVDEVCTLIRAEGTEEANARAEAYERDADPLDDRMVIIWFCDGQMLKLSEYYPMDSSELLYSVFSYEKGNASILGAIGVPRSMRDSQEALNAAWRMMMDNAALSVGPQILIDKSAVKPVAGDDWTMRPRKAWLFDSVNGGAQPFQVFNVPMNQEQIAGIIALAQAFIDEETAMPRIAEGGGNMEQAAGVTSTVGGLAMLMNAAGVNIRRIVKNWDDDVTSPLIRRFYDFNMQHSTRDEIKGDMEIVARGTGVLLVREMQASNLSAITQQWTVHPVLAAMTKPYGMARQTLQALSINPDEMLVTEEEYQKKIEAMAGAEGETPDPQWEVRERIATMETQARLREAEMQREVAVLKLAETSKVSIEKINAEMMKARMANDSSERKLAAEIGVEQLNKREANAAGRVPTGSGGAISMGSEAA